MEALLDWLVGCLAQAALPHAIGAHGQARDWAKRLRSKPTSQPTKQSRRRIGLPSTTSKKPRSHRTAAAKMIAEISSCPFPSPQQQYHHANECPHARRRHQHSAADISAARQSTEHHFDHFELIGDGVEVTAGAPISVRDQEANRLCRRWRVLELGYHSGSKSG
jgi:hypothetical protein